MIDQPQPLPSRELCERLEEFDATRTYGNGAAYAWPIAIEIARIDQRFDTQVDMIAAMTLRCDKLQDQHEENLRKIAALTALAERQQRQLDGLREQRASAPEAVMSADDLVKLIDALGRHGPRA